MKMKVEWVKKATRVKIKHLKHKLEVADKERRGRAVSG